MGSIPVAGAKAYGRGSFCDLLPYAFDTHTFFIEIVEKSSFLRFRLLAR